MTQQDVRDLWLFIHGNKACKLLANLTKETYKLISIPKIQDKTGTIHTNPDNINKISKEYYEILYSSQNMNEVKKKSFLTGIGLPSITQSQQLNAPITELEITKTLSQLVSNKAPGPDGFPIEFHKVMKESVLNTLTS